MAKILNKRVASIAILTTFVALACAVSGCAPTTASLVPNEIRATVAADARAHGPKLTAEDVLANALGKEGETVVAKTSPPSPTPNDGSINESIVAKTSSVDQLITAGISSHPKASDSGPSNAALASSWVEAGPQNFNRIHDKNLNDPTEGDNDLRKNADELFSSYLESVENDVSADDDYSLAQENPSLAVSNEHDAQALFNAARSAKASIGSAQAGIGSAQAGIGSAQAGIGQQTVDPNELLVRARSLLAAQNRAPNAIPRETLLQFSASETNLNPSHYSNIGAFIKQYPDKAITVSAALGSTGTAYEKLATAEQRLSQLSHLAPQFANAKRKIAPHLPPDTIEIKVGNSHDS